MAKRNWCFTINDASEVGSFAIPNDRNEIRYCVWQEEVCPETTRHHLQGYIELNKPMRYQNNF